MHRAAQKLVTAANAGAPSLELREEVTALQRELIARLQTLALTLPYRG